MVKNAWIRSCVVPSVFHRECLCGGLSLVWLVTSLVVSDSVSLVCVSVRRRIFGLVGFVVKRWRFLL